MAELDEDLRMLDELDSSSDQNKKGPPDPLSAKIAGSRSDLLANSVSITSFRSSLGFFHLIISFYSLRNHVSPGSQALKLATKRNI